MIQNQAGPARAPFALDRLVDYADEELLAELRRVAALVDRPRLTIKGFGAHARVSYTPIWQRFGGWRQALAAAGLQHRCGARPATAKLRAQAARRMTDDQILAELRRVARARRRKVLRVCDLDAASSVGYAAVVARFGSWPAALERARLVLSHRGRRYTTPDCFDNLAALWTALGRRPGYDDLRRPPSQIGPRAYVLRFGTWRRALAAFVAWSSGEGSSGDAATGAPAPPRIPATDVTPTPAPVPEERQRVSAALRFRVLERDRFRCMACGQSPANDPACTLEADHIVPFARGGKTAIGNLRTLCARCNRGKGARMPRKAGKARLPKTATWRDGRGRGGKGSAAGGL